MGNTKINKIILILISIFCISTKQAFAATDFVLYPTPMRPPVSLFEDSMHNQKTLGHYQGKVVILSFWSLQCRPCILEMPVLDKLQRKFKHQKLEILPITYANTRVSQIRSFYRNYKVKDLSYFIDVDNLTSSSFGVEEIPTSFIFNKKGKLIASTRGLINWTSPDNVKFIENLINE